jgi:Flp pilus assembly protein TadG
MLLPLLILLSLVLMEGGAMIRTHVVINNAAREGARFASSVQNMTAAEVQGVVASYAAMNGVTIADGEVTFIPEDPVAGPNGLFMRSARVTVQHPYTLTYLPNLPWGITPTRLLYARAEFRDLY